VSCTFYNVDPEEFGALKIRYGTEGNLVCTNIRARPRPWFLPFHL